MVIMRTRIRIRTANMIIIRIRVITMQWESAGVPPHLCEVHNGRR